MPEYKLNCNNIKNVIVVKIFINFIFELKFPLIQCCYVGVLHLMMVFEVRTPLTASTDEYTTNDQRVVELLSQGNVFVRK